MTAAFAAFQAGDAGGSAALTLGTSGVVGLVLILAAAASGWLLYVASRRPRAAEPMPASAPPPDPLEEAFESASRSPADAVLLCREGRIARVFAREGGPFEGLGGAVGGRLTQIALAEDVLPLAEAARAVQSGLSPEAVAEFALSAPGPAGSVQVKAKLSAPRGAAGAGFLAVLTDVSTHAAMARAAAEIQTRMATALSHIPDAVMITQIDGERERIVLANDGLRTILGMSGKDLGGVTLAELDSKLRASGIPGIFEALFDTGDEEGTSLVELPTKPPRRIERSFRRLSQSGGGGRIFTFRDKTHEHAALENLRRSVREAEGARVELARRHEEILLANEGLERRMADLAQVTREMKGLDEMKSNLLGNVSHELQTPLVSIRGYTEMMLKGRLGPLTEEQERGLKVALRNADRLIGMIEGLLAFVKAEREAEPLKIEVFPLRPLIEEVIALVGDVAAEKRVKVRLHVPPGDLFAKADRGRISQVFINLLTNAIKYNKQGGGVTIEVSRSSRSVAKVEVQDTGVGIPREEIERIFERFYRQEGTGESGSGLGLAIARDILRLHGCMIRADSDPGKGSTFSFTLPLDPRGKAERAGKSAGGEREQT